MSTPWEPFAIPSDFFPLCMCVCPRYKILGQNITFLTFHRRNLPTVSKSSPWCWYAWYPQASFKYANLAIQPSLQSSGAANKLPTAWQYLIIIHFAHPIQLHFPLGEWDCRHQHGQVTHLQDSKISRDDDDVCQLRPGVAWVVSTAPRNHFPQRTCFLTM